MPRLANGPLKTVSSAGAPVTTCAVPGHDGGNGARCRVPYSGMGTWVHGGYMDRYMGALWLKCQIGQECLMARLKVAKVSRSGQICQKYSQNTRNTAKIQAKCTKNSQNTGKMHQKQPNTVSKSGQKWQKRHITGSILRGLARNDSFWHLGQTCQTGQVWP